MMKDESKRRGIWRVNSKRVGYVDILAVDKEDAEARAIEWAKFLNVDLPIEKLDYLTGNFIVTPRALAEMNRMFGIKTPRKNEQR